MADENVQKALEEGKALREKSMSEFAERMKGKPTPTQDELNRIAVGEHVLEKEDDGSGPDLSTRSMEAGKPAAAYQTRQAQAARPAPPKAS